MFKSLRKFLAGATSTAVMAGLVTVGVVATATPAAANGSATLTISKLTSSGSQSLNGKTFTVNVTCEGSTGTVTASPSSVNLTVGGTASQDIAVSWTGNATSNNPVICKAVEPSPTSPDLNPSYGYFLPVFSPQENSINNSDADNPFVGEQRFTSNTTTTKTITVSNKLSSLAPDTEYNPLIQNACGINTTLVLDASGSIETAGAVGTVRQAATDFLDALKNTNSTARVTQFASFAQVLPSKNLVPNEQKRVPVDDASMAATGVLGRALSTGSANEGYYDPRPPVPPGMNVDGVNQNKDQYTNWDAALKEVVAEDEAIDRELVVFITDGDPTAYDKNATTVQVDTVDENGPVLTRAITQANLIKQENPNSRILVVGVGRGLTSESSVERLTKVSGPKTTNLEGLSTKTINDIDVAVVPQFNQLAAFLKNVVTELCTPSITVRKWVTSGNPSAPGYSNGFVPAPGWTFNATPTVTDPGTPAFDWVQPAGGDSTTPNKSDVTNAAGYVPFQWEPNPSSRDSHVVIKENLANQIGYTPGRSGDDWVCQTTRDGVVMPQTQGQLSQDGNSTWWKFEKDLGPKDKVTCDVYNETDTTLTLVKNVSPEGSADPTAWTLKAQAAGNLSQDRNIDTSKAGQGQGTALQVYAGVKYNLSEIGGPAGFDNGTSWSCPTGSMTDNDTAVTLTAGQHVVCTITNTARTKPVSLDKKWVGGLENDEFTMKIFAANGTVLDSDVAKSAGGDEVDANVASTSIKVGDKFTVGETPGTKNGGSYQASTECKANGTVFNPGDDGKYVVPDAAVTCTITNQRNSKTVSLDKKWVGGLENDEFTMKIFAANGTVLDSDVAKSAGGDEVDANVASTSIKVGDKFTVGETPGTKNGGSYQASTECKANGTVFNPGDDGKYVVPDAAVTCTITNQRTKNKVELVKKWVNSSAGDKADLEITGGINKPTKGTATAPDGETINTDAYSGETVTVTENVTGGYYDQQLVCKADGTKFDVAKDGSFTMPNSPVTCTFTNTRTTLKLVKQVDDKSDPNNWKLTATDPDGKVVVENLGDQGVPTNVKPDVEYTLAEDGPAGYTPGEWVCKRAVDTKGAVTEADLEDALNNGNKISLNNGANVVCTIINTRDLGSLKIVKWFDPKTSGYNEEFNIDYKCGDDPKQTVQIKGGESKTIDGIPTGTECTVSEVKPTDPPAGWSFSQPTFAPANGKVTVEEKGQTVTVTVTNEIIKPGIKIVKTASATSVTPGETVTYTYTVTNTGETPLSDVTVKDDKCSPVKYQSGDTNGDSKLQTTETWIYTCSQAISVATTNTAVVTGKDKNGQEVTAQDTITVAVVSPAVVKKVCPIETVLVKKIKKSGNRVLIKKIKTTKANCVLLKPVVLCKPIASSAAGETSFCDTKVTKKGRVTVKVNGYNKVRVTVVVRSKPKPGHEDKWRANTWRKSWVLKG